LFFVIMNASVLVVNTSTIQSFAVPIGFIKTQRTELSIEVTNANENLTNPQYTDSAIWTAIIGAFASAFGVFIGYLLTERVTMRLRKEESNLSTLKGICSILSEVEDNQEQVKKGYPVNLMAWQAARREPWYLSRKIGIPLRERTGQLYIIFGQYNETLKIMTLAKSLEINAQLAKFENDNLLNKKIESLKEDLLTVSKTLLPS
jgi:hypothetical protein